MCVTTFHLVLFVAIYRQLKKIESSAIDKIPSEVIRQDDCAHVVWFGAYGHMALLV